MNSQAYQSIFKNYFLPSGGFLVKEKGKFQQDNILIHVSISTKNWLQTNNVEILNNLFKSPYFISIKNF